MDKYLILQADDFGYNEAQNAAVSELLEEGLITSASVLAPAPGAEGAAEFLKRKNLSAGVHWALTTDGGRQTWQSLSRSPSFENGLPHEGKKLTFGARRRDVRAELEAQYDFLASRGIAVDHADSHSGALYGINLRRFYIDAFDICARRSLPYRFPKSPGFLSAQLGRPAPSAIVSVQKRIVSLGEARGVLMPDELFTNPQSVDDIGGIDSLRKYYLGVIENVPQGVSELFLHPALPYEGAEPSWQKRVWEYEILKSGCLVEKAKALDVKLISWARFGEMGRQNK